jgi:anti-sigma factor RsiW
MNRDDHIEDRLPAYLDERLEPLERARVARHLELCPACTRAAEQFRALERALDEDPEVPPLRAMWPAVAARRSPARRRIADVTFAMATAAALVAGFTLGVLGLGQPETPAVPETRVHAAVTTDDGDWLTLSGRTLSDVYFFDVITGSGNTQ